MRWHRIVFRLIAVLFVVIALLEARVASAEEEKDLTTPRRAVATFMQAADADDWTRAASVLDLHLVPQSKTKGPELAKQLHRVIVSSMWLELATISDDPIGKATDGPDTEEIGKVSVSGKDVPIVLSRTKGAAPIWQFSSSTVGRVPMLYEDFAPSWLETRVPHALTGTAWGLAAWQWIGLVLAFAFGVAIGRALTWVAGRILGPLAARTPPTWDDELLVQARAPMRMLTALLAFRFLLEPLSLAAAPTHIIYRLVVIASIGATGWLAIRACTVLAGGMEARASKAAKGVTLYEFRARGVATQVRVLRRVINVAIGIVTIALMLTQFEVVRNLGVSLLASAGLAGVVLGFAAQRTFGSLIAGIQLSATQPIRIGDSVVIEKEFGVIEEVTLTYVVVKIWDERRLIVPVSRFLEQPFENWTKTSSELHGTVFLQVDWTCPVEMVRAELDKILEGHPQWDGRTKKVHVTDAKERTLELRILVSARNANALSDLRFDIRERLVRWVQSFDGGRYLPREREENVTDAAPENAVASGPPSKSG